MYLLPHMVGLMPVVRWYWTLDIYLLPTCTRPKLQLRAINGMMLQHVLTFINTLATALGVFTKKHTHNPSLWSIACYGS